MRFINLPTFVRAIDEATSSAEPSVTTPSALLEIVAEAAQAAPAPAEPAVTPAVTTKPATARGKRLANVSKPAKNVPAAKPAAKAVTAKPSAKIKPAKPASADAKTAAKQAGSNDRAAA